MRTILLAKLCCLASLDAMRRDVGILKPSINFDHIAVQYHIEDRKMDLCDEVGQPAGCSISIFSSKSSKQQRSMFPPSTYSYDNTHALDFLTIQTDPSVLRIQPRLAPSPVRSPNRYSPYASPRSTNSGRWSLEEHQQFLDGVNLYGRSWKKIADLIPTRSSIQVRTHAQKHFQRVERKKECVVNLIDSPTALGPKAPEYPEETNPLKTELCLDDVDNEEYKNELVDFMTKLDTYDLPPPLESLPSENPTDIDPILAAAESSRCEISNEDLLFWAESFSMFS